MSQSDGAGGAGSGQRVHKTYIPGLDRVLNGGIPEGHVVLLSGEAGTGKTVLSMQWLFEGARNDEPGVYLAITEPITKAVRNIETMSFFDRELLDSEALQFTDLRSMTDSMNFEEKEQTLDRDDVEQLIGDIAAIITETGAKRLVIDSITAIGYMIDDPTLFRHFVFQLGTLLSTKGCTTFLTSEKWADDAPFNIEDFISDGVFEMENRMGEQSMVRTLNVSKMRGVDYRSGTVNFSITSDGIQVFPKIPVDMSVAKTDFENRLGTGIPKLDELTGGGYPRGHMILMGGNTGAGKTTLGLEFLIEGMEQGESAVFVNLEESAPQLRKTAEAHGWDLAQYEEDDLFRFVAPRGRQRIDIAGDQLLYDILDAVDEMDATRVVLDSISALESASMDSNKVRELLLQLAGALKVRGTTGIMTYLTSEMFNSASGQRFGSMQSSDLRLSSIVDGIVLLRYIEEDDTVKKALHVLKMRGSDHDKDIWEFDVGPDGASILGRFDE